MAFRLNDRVKETTTSTGTGPVLLLGAVGGFQPFSTAIGAGNNTYYTIVESGDNPQWEVGNGTYDGTFLSRDLIYSSSNNNQLVVFATGIKYVYVDLPSSRLMLNVFVPAMAFTGSAAGGINQVFTNPLLRMYNIAHDVQLFLNGTTKLIGVPLGSDFTLDNIVGTITVSSFLPANASLFIDSKVVSTVGETFYLLNENAIARFLNENGIDIFRTEIP